MHRNMESEMKQIGQNCQFGLLLAISLFLNNDLSAHFYPICIGLKPKYFLLRFMVQVLTRFQKCGYFKVSTYQVLISFS